MILLTIIYELGLRFIDSLEAWYIENIYLEIISDAHKRPTPMIQVEFSQ
jgi:hypothetical protein